MNLRLNRKQLFIMLALFAVCLAGAAGLYWFVLAPAKSGLAGQKAALKSEQQVLSSLQSKKQQSPELQLGNVVSLMRKIPAKPLAEQVLLQFRMAEALSGSRITETDAQQDSAGTSGSEEATQSTTSGTSSGTQQKTDVLPAGVKKLSYTLKVESDSYKSMKTFLQTIENLPRITVIESLNFSPGEGAPGSSGLQYTVTVSTFYYPALSRYSDYLPEIDVPAAGRKSDPVATTAQ
ncbi:type 4a pilus biogenesis protein PilO [Weizmannia sp. FSL K6-0777]|uniref:type 4a pilus biogenesis protein PilO n=1 Tax=Weizmannia sp. FSL K6-0777 TaxID=2954674 RepID=UPI00315809AB